MTIDANTLRVLVELMVIAGGALSIVIGLRVTYRELDKNTHECERLLGEHSKRIAELDTRIAICETKLEAT